MRPRPARILSLLVAISALALAAAGPAAASPPTTPDPVTVRGTTPAGANWTIRLPGAWNGTLLLYSHGYEPPGTPRGQGPTAPDPATAAELLRRGYALAGSSYRAGGWAVREAMDDQMQLLALFKERFGAPKRTIAWGTSLGGMITAGLIQRHPESFDAGLPMCGLLVGAVGMWNYNLDMQYALKTLMQRDPALAAAASALQLVHIADGPANAARASQVIDGAAATPQGRARLALVAAIGDLPGWFAPGSPEPADLQGRLDALISWVRFQTPFIFNWHAEVEARAGGNPSWNVGVDYERIFRNSVDRDTVKALYEQAGLRLGDDLEALQRGPRIAADPRATRYLLDNVTYDGRLRRPVLTLHTTGDGLVVVQNERAYADGVRAAGRAELLRRLSVRRAGHCTFTPAEMLTALGGLEQRLDTGSWPAALDDPALLNAQAADLEPTLNARMPQPPATAPTPTPPAFVAYRPGPHPRPFYREWFPWAVPIAAP